MSEKHDVLPREFFKEIDMMKCFNYFSPKTVKEASEILMKHGNEARVMAGGTDLLVEMKNEKLAPCYVVDLKCIPGLNKIRKAKKNGLRIGALVTLREIESSPIIRKDFPILADAGSLMGSVQIRNRGTIGGNLCHASPAADLAPPLIALEAEVKIFGISGERIEKLEDFIEGPNLTSLKPGEILEEIYIPSPLPYSCGTYLKFGPRKAVALSAVSVATQLVVNEGGSVCSRARVVLGAVGPTPIRATESERLLEGRRLDRFLLQEAGKLAAEVSKPITDIRGSAWYRKELVRALVEQSLFQTLDRVNL